MKKLTLSVFCIFFGAFPGAGYESIHTPVSTSYTAYRDINLRVSQAETRAQTLKLMAPAQSPKTLEALRLDCTPALDGQLTDSCWQQAPILEEFTTSTPVFGNQPLGRTEVRLFYTETALYVAAHCFNAKSGKVRDDAGIRDGELTGDWFQLSLDTWNDDRLAFDFMVSAAGVLYDTRNSSGWNANWQSAVSVQADGWALEMRIPFTALRFPRKAEQNWGLQFTRFDRAAGETSTWNPQNPLVQDRVLQFGTLSGLRNLHQARRLGFSAYSNMSLRTEANPLSIQNISQTLSLDGRVGLNQSATLDFTLLPPTEAIAAPDKIIPDPEVDFRHNIGVTEPRQFFQEERDLFDKNPRLEYNPVIYWMPFLNDHPLGPGERYTGGSESKLLHAAKLTARTKGNWRFGVYNAFLGPVKATVGDDQTREAYTKTLQAFSNYNYASAEYVLPNNGFVQLSNASLLAGPNLTTAAPRLDFRLRNRNNALELGGTGQMIYEQADTVRQQHYNYGIRLARVNRRWGWAASLNEQYRPAKGNNPATLYGTATAGANYRDFRPRGPFLNIEGALTAYLNYINKISLPEDVLNVFGHVAVTNRRFQRLALDFSVRPYSIRQAYHNGNATLYRRTAPLVNPGFSFITDQRKRFIAATSLYVSANTAGEIHFASLTIQPSWVIGRRLRLQADLETRAWLNQLSALPVIGRWIFQRTDQWALAGRLNLHWYPAEKLLLFGYISARGAKITRRETVEMLDADRIVPVDWPLSEIGASPVYGEAALGFQYFFTPLSQIRFQHVFGEEESLYYRNKPSPDYYYRTRGRTELTLACFLDGVGKRGAAARGIQRGAGLSYYTRGLKSK